MAAVEAQVAATQPIGVAAIKDTTAEDFQAAEKLLLAEFKKPFRERNMQGLLDTYSSIGISSASHLAPYIKARKEFLQAGVDHQAVA